MIITYVKYQTFFDEYIYVEYNEESIRSSASIRHKISEEAYMHVCIMHDVYRQNKLRLDTAYRFLIKGFRIGSDITFMRNDPDVWSGIYTQKVFARDKDILWSLQV